MRSSCTGRGTRHNGAVLDGRRRPGNIASRVRCSECALLGRRDTHVICYLRAAQRSFADMSGAAIHSLATGEAAARSSRYCVSVVRVRVVKIVGGVDDIHVANESVANVYPLREPVSAMEPRDEGFTKTQREPADAETSTKSEASAKETNKRRTIDTRAKSRAGVPAPSIAYVSPSSIVKGSKAPRRIVNPRPAPRSDITPIAVAVGSPVR